jgi:cytohesin
MNAKNISGNTPLHVSATRNSTECAKYLLLRGANKNILNKVNQQPVQVAIMSQNLDLAEMISKHKDEDISMDLKNPELIISPCTTKACIQ